jgi:hypothetical protein
VKPIRHKHFTRSRLANIEAKSYATGLASSASALDAGIWLAEANVTRDVFIKPYFLRVIWIRQKTNENNVQNPQASLNQATVENVTAQDYLNLDGATGTEAATKETSSLNSTSKPAAKIKMTTKEKELSKNCRWNANCNLTAMF